jgi:hypothetical protein
MNKSEIISLISDPTFIESVRSISDKSPIENASFIAVICTALITAIAVVVGALQLRDLAQAAREDHRRSRREFAIALIQFWAANHRHESQSTRLFVETLNMEQCKNLFDYKPLKIDSSSLPRLVACLQHSFPKITQATALEGDTIKSVYAAHIRYTVIAYLNSLEVVMIAWHHEIADREIILKEFKFLVKPGEGSAALETFRVAIGVDAFAGINAFVKALRERTPVEPSQPSTGNI